MDKAQKSKKNMLVKLLAFLGTAANSAIFAGLAPMVLLVSKLVGDNDTWNGLITKEAVETTGITTDQDAAKHIMADEFGMIGMGAYGYFLSVGNNTLAVQCNHSGSEIYSLGNSEAAGLCDSIVLAVGPFMTPLVDYGITSGLITAADGMITNFEGYLGAAKAGEAVKSAAGVAIDTLIRDVVNPRLEILDAQVGGVYFRNEEDFRTGYAAVRALDGLPTSHTEYNVQFYKRGTTDVIIGAMIKEMVSGKAAVSDNVGLAHLVKLRGGKNLMFEASCAGYVTRSIVQTIVQGKKIAVVIELTAI